MYLSHNLNLAAHNFPMKNYCSGKFLIIYSETFSILLISFISPYPYVSMTGSFLSPRAAFLCAGASCPGQSQHMRDLCVVTENLLHHLGLIRAQ